MTKRTGKVRTDKVPAQEVAYEDTWAGRGQELQDQEDLDAGRLEGEGTSQSRAPGTNGNWAFPAKASPEPTPEEHEEMATRQRWTVGRNKAFADLRAKAPPTKPDPTDE